MCVWERVPRLGFLLSSSSGAEWPKSISSAFMPKQLALSILEAPRFNYSILKKDI